jgi:Flp pilus assembly protein TadG
MLSSAFCRKLHLPPWGDAGTAALEFGLTAPFMVLLMVGVVEIGTSMYQAMQAQNAAEAGAIYAAKHGFNATGISSAVANATQSAGITANPAPSQFCGCPSAGGVTEVDCASICTGGSAPGQYVRITARITHSPLVSFTGVSVPAAITGEAVVRIY